MKFKKTISFVLALLLTFSSVGFNMHKHYCLGVLKSVSIASSEKFCAEKWGLEDDSCAMSCCEDTVEQIQSDDFQNLGINQVNFGNDWTYISPFGFELLSVSYTSGLYDGIAFNPYNPPPLIDVDLPVLHQSFLL